MAPVSGPFVLNGMQEQASRLRVLLEPVVTGLGYELVGVLLLPAGRGSVLRIYIDHAPGVTVADCERVSRQVSAVLDVENAVRGSYTLEVSSPGLDRPLFTPEHFARFAGANVRVHLHVPQDGRRKFVGRLGGMRGDAVVVECEGVERLLPMRQIARARLVPESNMRAGSES
jgi:ribosome maturation factor RimP